MNKQKTVDSKVLAILRECPETRYDDMQLILCYYNRYSYMRVGDLPLEDIVNNYKGYGEKISIKLGDGKTMERTCRYIDDYHLEVGTNLYHICEFAELCERNGHTVEPAAKENTKSAKDKEKTR